MSQHLWIPGKFQSDEQKYHIINVSTNNACTIPVRAPTEIEYQNLQKLIYYLLLQAYQAIRYKEIYIELQRIFLDIELESLSSINSVPTTYHTNIQPPFTSYTEKRKFKYTTDHENPSIP